MDLTVLQDGSERIRYRDPAVPIYITRGDLRSMTDMSALCHWHEDVELLMPLRGYLSYNVDGAVIPVEEGDGIFVNARHMHYGFSADRTDCEYICITFRPQLLCANEAVRDRYVLPVLTSPSFSHTVLHSSHPEHAPLLALIRQIDATFREQEPGSELLVLSALFALWQGIFRMAQAHIREAVAADRDLLIQKRMLEFIRIHYRERITLDVIAAAGGVCRTKCCQLFRKYLNRTPNDYLNSFRLEKGMELLKSTDMTVTEIADACGFTGASYFTELFTKQKGCPPRAYRKSTR